MQTDEIPNVIEPGEPHYIDVVINGETIRFPIYEFARMAYDLLPGWLKSSKVAIKIERTDYTPQKRHEEETKMEMARSGLKGLVAGMGLIPDMGKSLYGEKWRLSMREDTMPIISQWMLWFLISHLALNPLEIFVDKDGIVRGIQPLHPIEGEEYESN